MSKLSPYFAFQAFPRKVTGLWLIAAVLACGAHTGFTQSPSPRAWAERVERSVLVLVYPSHAVRKERVTQALADLPADSPARRRATRQLEGDEASRDTLLVALSQSFQTHYRLHKVFFMADTTYHRHWKQGHREVPVLVAESLETTVQAWEPTRVLILRQRAGDRDTGTGITQWTLETGDGGAYPDKFPDTFPDGGNLGNRFLQFFHAMFRGGNRPDRLSEVLPATDYLARQVQKKWGRYMERLGFEG